MSFRSVTPASFGTLLAIKRFKPGDVNVLESSHGPLYLAKNPVAVEDALSQLVQANRVFLNSLPQKSGEFGGVVAQKKLTNGDIQVTLQVTAPTPELEECVAEELLEIPASKKQPDGSRLHSERNGWFFRLDAPAWRQKSSEPFSSGKVRAFKTYPDEWGQVPEDKLNRFPPYKLPDAFQAANQIETRFPLTTQQAVEEGCPENPWQLPAQMADVALALPSGRITQSGLTTHLQLLAQSARQGNIHQTLNLMAHLLGFTPGQPKTLSTLQKHGWTLMSEINPTEHVAPELLQRFFGVKPNPKIVPLHGKERILASTPYPVSTPEKAIDKETLRRTLRQNTAALRSGKAPTQQTPFYYAEPKNRKTFSPEPSA